MGFASLPAEFYYRNFVGIAMRFDISEPRQV
jgi:hypothetical protein